MIVTNEDCFFISRLRKNAVVRVSV